MKIQAVAVKKSSASNQGVGWALQNHDGLHAFLATQKLVLVSEPKEDTV